MRRVRKSLNYYDWVKIDKLPFATTFVLLIITGTIYYIYKLLGKDYTFFLILLITASFLCICFFIRDIVRIILKLKKDKELKQAILSTGIEQVNNLNPYEFEKWIAEMLSLGGYETETTKKSGDYGVDVIAKKGSTTIAIQVKKYTNPLGVKCVQEVIAGMQYYNANEGWVMSTAPSFTRQAQNQASVSNIKLFTYNDLAIFLKRIQRQHANEN